MERKRNRPKNSEKQEIHDSGQQRQPTDKNIIISHRQIGRVGFQSPIYSGTVHVTRLAKHEQIHFLCQSVECKDTGYQGYELGVKQTLQQKKDQKVKN